MHKRFAFLEKKESTAAILISPNGVYLVISSRRFRRKMLKGTKLFIAKVSMASKEWSNAAILDTIQEWWEDTFDELLYERLINSTSGSRPVIIYDERMIIDFNKGRDDFTSALFDEGSEFYGDVND